MAEEKKKRDEFVVKIGPLMRNILDKQRNSVMNATYDVCNSSDWEAGEILAKKIEEYSLVK